MVGLGSLIDRYFPALRRSNRGPVSLGLSKQTPDELKNITGTPIQTIGSNPLTGGSSPVNTMPGVIGISPAANAALASAAVWACCRLISTSLAALPPMLFRLSADGKQQDPSHPLFALLTQSPNPLMTMAEWIQPTLLGLLLFGNGYTWVDRIDDQVVGIWPLNPARVSMVLNLDGTFAYYYSDFRGKFNIFTDREIIHFRVFTMDGFFGLPVLIYHQLSIGLANASTTFATALYNNGGQPSGVLEYPGVLKPDQVQRIRQSWADMHSGPSNAGRVAILEEGTKYEAIGIPPEQLQYIQEQRFSVEQIARIFGVPPHLIGAAQQPTYASVEQQSIEFVRYTLFPYVRALEAGIDKAMLDPTHTWRFNLDAFERGDIASRYASYAIGRQWGWLSPNDVLRAEDKNTFPGGDEYLTPLNMIAVPAGQVPPPVLPQPPPRPGVPRAATPSDTAA